jgi:hypothetical protein
MAAHGENEVKLRDLSPKHKQVAALLSQGLGRTEISQIVDFTPEYITWLMRDPQFKEYQAEMNEITNARLEALFGQVPDLIHRNMNSGIPDAELKAARLHLEVTKRIGKQEEKRDTESSLARLEILAERLLNLNNRSPNVIDVEAT